MAEVQLEQSWKQRLTPEFESTYMQNLRAFLVKQKQARKVVFPPGEQMFQALNLTPFDAVRVVIIGQDPYHGPGQAHGLSFSVPAGVPQPPSLVNILQEINDDLGDGEHRIPKQNGCLLPWASQGVLLLNAVLSVEQGRAGSHQGQGWETFTDSIVSRLNSDREHLVFMLWGAYAQKKGSIVDPDRHLVLKAPHPSPLSAHRGFFGCRHFSQANQYLVERGGTAIDWFAVQ
ncbi:MAG: uracil-DNA glycosylase [Pseudomonadales bacterium]